MVVIRLSRTGAVKRPFYHVVVTDSRNALNSGRYIERLGYFNPIATGGEVRLHFDQERLHYWQSQGAQLSERVVFLLKEFTKNPTQHADAQAAHATKRKATVAAEKITKAAREQNAAQLAARRPKPAKKPSAKAGGGRGGKRGKAAKTTETTENPEE